MTDFPTTFLMWANKDPRYPDSFIIKIDQQILLGLTRTDKNSTTYWKFKKRTKPKVSPETKPEPNPVMDNIQKFQQRQSQVKSHDQASSNSTDNNF